MPGDNQDPNLIYQQARTETDPGRALGLYCRAARYGHAAAQLHLGTVFAGGQGVEQDLSAAMLWYDMALLNGAEEARELRRIAGRRATADDFARYRTYNNDRMAIPCENTPK